MKTNSIFSLSILVLAVITAFGSKSFAQAKYFPGYVIMLNGDSLKGELKKNPKREFDNFAKASFRKKEGAEIKAYTAAKIKEYCVDGTIYVSRNVEGEQVFIRLISAPQSGICHRGDIGSGGSKL